MCGAGDRLLLEPEAYPSPPGLPKRGGRLVSLGEDERNDVMDCDAVRQRTPGGGVELRQKMKHVEPLRQRVGEHARKQQVLSGHMAMLPQEFHAPFKPAGQRKGCLTKGGDCHVGVAWRTGTIQQTAGEFRRVAADATAGVPLEAHLHGGAIEADSHGLTRASMDRRIVCQPPCHGASSGCSAGGRRWSNNASKSG